MDYEITKHSVGSVFKNKAEEALAAANQEAAERGRTGWTMINSSTIADQYGLWTIFMFWQRDPQTYR